MAGIVRKLFKSSGSSRKAKKEERFDEDHEVESDNDDDYAELHFGPTTSSSYSSPPRTSSSLSYHHHHQQTTIQFNHAGLPISIATPRLTHDQTLDSDQSFEQPNQKRRRVVADSIFDISNEESIYEHTQNQLMKWERQEDRNQERRKRKRVERHVEQENYVHSAFGEIKLEKMPAADVEKLRRERDQYKREMEKYKRKFEDLEKKYKHLEKEKKRQTPVFQPLMPGYNFFGAPQFPQYFQPQMAPLLPTPPPSTFLLQQQPSQQPSTSSQIMPFGVPSSSLPPSNPTPIPTMDSSFSLGPSGPMAPRYPDPYNFNQDDDDTSLSDLSNSSKSDTSSDDLK